MSTTTTIYPASDTRLSEPNATTNYGTDDKLKIGYASGSGMFDSSVLEFDLSSYVQPRDIVQATLTIVVLTEWGTGGAETLNVARCTKEFVEGESTWNNYASGSAWDTVGGDFASTETTYTSMTVGASSGDQSVDIRELIVDAINRRESTLRLLIWMNHTPSWTAIATYGSVDHANISKRPTIDITVADRITWINRSGDGSLDTALNWSSGSIPTSSDHVLFNTDSEDVTSGSLACHSVFVGRQFSGDIEQTDGTGLDLSASSYGNGQRITTASKKSRVHFDDGGGRDLYISATSGDGCKFTPQVSSSHNCIVSSASKLEVSGDCNLVATGRQAKDITLSGTTTDIICGRGTYLTLEDGCKTIKMYRSRCTCSGGILMAGSGSFLAGGSICYAKNGSIDTTVDIYDGLLSLSGNTNAAVYVDDIRLWPNGMFDGRTGAPSYSPTTTPGLLIHGGKFRLDAGRLVAIQ